MAVTCPHCKLASPDDARFCPRCGRALDSKVAGPGTAIAILLVILFFVIVYIALCSI